MISLEDDMVIEEVRDEPALLSLECEWKDLLAQGESNIFFLTHEWVTCWWRHFGQPRHLRGRAELFVLAVRRRGRLCGVAPLMVEVERFLGISSRVVRFLANGMSDYSDFILADDRDALLQAIVQHLLARSAVWDVIDLREFYGASPNLSALQRLLRTAGFVLHTEFDHFCPFITIEGQWETFYRSQFGRHHRKDHRRELRNLQLAGAPSLRFVTSLEDKPDVIERIAEIERHHPNAGPGRPRFLNMTEHRGFFEEVLPRTARLGWLTIAFLDCDGQPVAYYLCFHYNRRYILYITAYRREFTSVGVGRLLMLRMLEQYWNAGGDEIDFGRAEWLLSKSHRSLKTRQNLRLVASQRSLRSRSRWWLWFVLLPALQHRFPRIHYALSIASESGWAEMAKRGLRRLKRAALEKMESLIRDGLRR